ncbi:MAG: glycoside hydrolase family 5 protein [Lachnospiraceae bacterium]|nr:glycoside hydrolase family 5 protein [Lachnospiraceae bacterium]
MFRKKQFTYLQKTAGLILTMCLMTFLMGCSNADSAEESAVEDRVLEKAVLEGSIIESSQEDSAESEAEPAESIAAENENTENENTEKANTKMEDLTAMDIVKDMKIGWNIGNTLDSTRTDITRMDASYKFETAWGNPEVTPELIDTVLDSGFNVIRIPVSWTNHIGPEPEYQITESWMERVREVVDYAYDKGAYVILNIHHEDWNYPYYDNLDRASAEMAAVWKQIAEVFKDYDEHLIFEGQNEPRKVGTSLEWNGGDAEGWEVVNKTNQVFIDTVRAAGGSNPYRMLMIPGYAANCSVGIRHIEVPENDNRVIISVHAYEPYDFALNKDGRSEWNHDTDAIDRLMKDLQALFLDNGTPVIIGEFGAMNKNNESERAEWAAYYVSAAKKVGVPCIWWDNGLFEGDGERFGLFDRHTYECKYPDLLDALTGGQE